jgi:two-component system, cell cycle response regulator DivK
VSTARHPLRVLIINAFDEREMYAEALQAAGLSVTTAATATQGLEQFLATMPDVVVQGMAFSDRAGIALAGDLSRLRSPATSLIVITGFTDAARLDELHAMRCDAVLLKPCLPEQLLRTVKRVHSSRVRGGGRGRTGRSGRTASSGRKP